jgi:hypothetical protein
MIYYIRQYITPAQHAKLGRPFKNSRTYINHIREKKLNGLKIDTEWFLLVNAETERQVFPNVDQWPQTPQQFSVIPNEFIKIHRAADILKVRTSTLYEAIVMQQLDGYWIGGIMFVYLSKVRQHFLNSGVIRRR